MGKTNEDLNKVNHDLQTLVTKMPYSHLFKAELIKINKEENSFEENWKNEIHERFSKIQNGETRAEALEENLIEEIRENKETVLLSILKRLIEHYNIMYPHFNITKSLDMHDPKKTNKEDKYNFKKAIRLAMIKYLIQLEAIEDKLIHLVEKLTDFSLSGPTGKPSRVDELKQVNEDVEKYFKELDNKVRIKLHRVAYHKGHFEVNYKHPDLLKLDRLIKLINITNVNANGNVQGPKDPIIFSHENENKPKSKEDPKNIAEKNPPKVSPF